MFMNQPLKPYSRLVCIRFAIPFAISISYDCMWVMSSIQTHGSRCFLLVLSCFFTRRILTKTILMQINDQIYKSLSMLSCMLFTPEQHKNTAWDGPSFLFLSCSLMPLSIASNFFLCRVLLVQPHPVPCIHSMVLQCQFFWPPDTHQHF